MNKKERREMMPQTAEWVDEITKVFGPPAAIKAQENGHKIDWKSNDERLTKVSGKGG